MSGMHLKTALSPEPIITWQVVEPTLFSHFSPFSSPPFNFPLHPRVGISEPQPVNVAWLTHLESAPLHPCSNTDTHWEEGHEKPQTERRLLQKTNTCKMLSLHTNYPPKTQQRLQWHSRGWHSAGETNWQRCKPVLKWASTPQLSQQVLFIETPWTPPAYSSFWQQDLPPAQAHQVHET